MKYKKYIIQYKKKSKRLDWVQVNTAQEGDFAFVTICLLTCYAKDTKYIYS